MSIACAVYRCSRQDQMYIYVRAGLDPSTLPPALLQRTGALTHVMDLELTPQRRLARVDAERVRQKLAEDGWYLQMPPGGEIRGHEYFGD